MSLGDMVPAAVTSQRQPVPTSRACQGQSGWEGMWHLLISDLVLLLLQAEGNCQIENPALHKPSQTPKITRLKLETTQIYQRTGRRGQERPRCLHLNCVPLPVSAGPHSLRPSVYSLDPRKTEVNLIVGASVFSLQV